MKLIRIGLSLTAILVIVLLNASPVLANTANPDSSVAPPTISVYRNLLETGDRLFLIYANIPYTVPPSTPVTATFIWRLFDTDNTSELGQTVGSVYQNSGYGYNLYSLYFSAADNITWGETYPIRLSGNPVVFSSPPEYNFQVNVSDYKALLTQDIEGDLRALAADLDRRWGLTTSTSLLTQSEAGTVLSIRGENFFRAAIYGVQAFAPGIFSFVIKDVDIADRTWDTEYSSNLTSQWAGTWIETSQEAYKAMFGKDYDLVSFGMVFLMVVGIVIADVSLTSNIWGGLIDAALVMVLGARLSLYPPGFLGLIAAIAIIYLGIKLKGIWSS